MSALDSPGAVPPLDAAVAPAISPALDFCAGTVAGIASLLTGHPFDTGALVLSVKVRLQTQAKPSKPSRSNVAARTGFTSTAGAGHHTEVYYRNAVHAFVRVTREEGVSGLYKGVMSPMLGVALMNASVFTSYKYAMNAMLATPEAEPNLWQITAAGSASGVFTSLITTPIDRLKILQQALVPAVSAGASSSAVAVQQPSLLTLVRSMSLPSLYRGWSATILRDIGYGPYFLTYEYVVRGGSFGLFSSDDDDSNRRHVKADLKEEIDGEVFGIGEGEAGGASTVRVLVAGGLAGIVGWGCTFPIDVIKTKIQSVPPVAYGPSTSASSSATTPYISIRATVAATLRESGWRGFVAGLGPTLVRSVPVNMVTFAVFELVVSTFR